MGLVTISSVDIEEYDGTLVPSYALAFASAQFTDTTGVIVAQSSKTRPHQGQRFAASLVSGKIRIASGDLYSTTDSNNPDVTYSLTVYDAKGRPIWTSSKTYRVPPITPTTWKTLETFSAARPLRNAPTYLDSESILSILSGYTNAAPVGSDVINGIFKVDVPAEILASPVVVGANSPRVSKVLSLDYGNSFATAITAIGAAKTTLLVKSPITVTANTTIPVNIDLSVSDLGLITVNTGVTLTVGKLVNPGNRQVFAQQSSTANIRFSVGAVNAINIAWFVGQAGVCTNAINQALASCSANTGGVVYFPQGDWTTTGDHQLPSNTTILGNGEDTVLTAIGFGTAIFIHMANVYYVNVRNITLDGGGFNIAAYACRAAYGEGSAGHLKFEGVVLQNATYGLKIQDTDSTEWQMAAISIDANCRIRNNTYGIWCNSQNNLLECNAFIEVAANQWAVYFTNAGQWTFTQAEWAGSAYTGETQIESQTIVSASGITAPGIAQSVVTWTGVAGTPVTVSVPVDVTMTTATLIATAFRKALGADPSITAFFHIGGTGATIELITIDRLANVGTANFTINTGTATGITNNATSANTWAGIADTTQAQGMYVGGAHGAINFFGGAEEAFRNFIVNDASDINGVINLVGFSVQSAIRLNQTCTLNTIGCYIVDRSIRNAVTGAAMYHSTNDVVAQDSYFGGAFRTLSARTPHNFNGNTTTNGSGQVAISINQFERRVDQQFSQRIFHNDTQFFDSRTQARQELMSSVDPGIGANWPMLRIGRCTPTGEPSLYYDWYRRYDNGRLVMVGNQTTVPGAVGFDFNGDMTAVNFRGAELAPAIITANQNNYNPGSLAQNLILTSNAAWNLTGLTFDYAQNGGDIRVIQNGGSFNIVLVHDATSTAANRFFTTTGADVTLTPGDVAYLIYDGVARRWRTWASDNLGVATATSIAIGGGTALTTTNRTGTGNLVLATAPTIANPVVTGRISTSTVTALTSSATIALDASLGNVFTLTPAHTANINVTGMVVGQPITLRILTSVVTPYVLTFNTGFISEGTLSTGSVSGKYFQVVFECTASLAIEASRTLAM